MSKYLLGIDRGTTNVKAIIFDFEGNQIKKVSRSSGNISHPHPGWSEQDMNIIWASTGEAIRGLFDDGQIKGEEIVAIGICGQGNGIFLIDDRGEPVRPGILSVDTRTKETIRCMKEESSIAKAESLLDFPIGENGPLGMLRWLKENEYDNYTRIDKFFFSKDWVKYKLTGEVSTDQSDAGGAALINNYTGKCPEEIFDILGINECKKKRPTIVPTWEITGRVTADAARETGLLVGTPVVSGAHDIAACSFGAGGIEEGHLTMIVGTWGLNLSVLNNFPEYDGSSMVFQHVIPNRWLACAGDGNSGSSLQWFIDTFCSLEVAQAEKRRVSVFELIEEGIKDLPPQAIIYHPFIFGRIGQASARAGLYGMSAWHNKWNVLKAVYEGITCAHYGYIQGLMKLSDIKDVWLVGGGAASNIWGQIFADVTGFTVKIPKINEIASRGVALSAGIGAGIFENHQAANLPLQVRAEYNPNPDNHKRYDKLTEIYQNLSTVLQDTWEDLYQFSKAEY